LGADVPASGIVDGTVDLHEAFLGAPAAAGTASASEFVSRAID
jgi:hypothetical protein